MITSVLNLETGATLWYSLPAPAAVVSAFEAHHKNFNTWQYRVTDNPLIEFGPSGKTVFCGQFGAVIKTAP